MFTCHNLWFGLRGHWWSFENQPSLFSSLGKYLGWFLIMSLRSQKPKDFGVKNWYFAGSETPQRIHLEMAPFVWVVKAFHRFALCTFGRFESLEIESWKLYYSVFYSTFFSPRKNGEGISNIWRLGCSQLFSLNLDSFPVSLPSPFRGITEYHGHFHEDLSVLGETFFAVISLDVLFYRWKRINSKIGPTFNYPPRNYDFTPAKWWVGRR